LVLGQVHIRLGLNTKVRAGFRLIVQCHQQMQTYFTVILHDVSLFCPENGANYCAIIVKYCISICMPLYVQCV